MITIVQSFGSTDTGRKRRRNEDAFVCEPPLFAVADGMGGAQAGEVASGLAAAALRESGADGGGERRVAQLIQEANRRVHDRATSDATASGMGTTITAALFGADGRVAFGHVGDSRAYLLRDGRLDQLTDDHSLVAELVRRGELSPQEAEVHPQRSVITRALGTDPDVDVDTFSVDARAGDVFLICSDGLSSYVDGGEIEDLVSRNRRDLQAAAKALIYAANRGGGEDNITAVLFSVGGAEPEERTREYATVPEAREPDLEDTLHPEDGIPVITEPLLPGPPLDGEPADNTVVMSTADILANLPSEPVTPAEDEAPPAAEPEAEQPTEEQPAEAGLGRRVLASAVIVALVALIVFLAWWGLAR